MMIGLSLLSCSDSSELPQEALAVQDKLPELIDYNIHVKPILSDRCFKCHGPDKNKIEAGLQLASFEGATKSLKSGVVAIDPGNINGSELIKRILSHDPDEVMPTPKSNLTLSDEEKAILVKWIKQGAEYKEHWSLSPIQQPDVPRPGTSLLARWGLTDDKQTRWVRNDIDRFTLAKMNERGLKPSPEANKITLLRHQDDPMRNAYPYRDWVIRAFNQNKPFDQFITEQLAGDLLPGPSLRRTGSVDPVSPAVQRDRLVATSFNRQHAQSGENGIVPEEYRIEYVADRTNTFGKAMLGLTMECCWCHDHKYDSISHKDYYSLFAFFNQNKETEKLTFKFQGRRYRLTDVAGKVVKPILT